MAERIGIFGGSFNPVHNGHLVMAQDALEQFGLARVILMPADQPPHKPSPVLVPAADRLEMLRLAVAGDPRFEVSDDEVQRGGISYTVDTVQRLCERYPNDRLHLIIGGDSLFELHTWKDILTILARCEVITVARPGFSAATCDPSRLNLPNPWPRQLLANVVTGHLMGVSSTDLRQRLASGHSIRYLVPEAVERYIRTRALYRTQETCPSKR